jgi:hypothetical protein
LTPEQKTQIRFNLVATLAATKTIDEIDALVEYIEHGKGGKKTILPVSSFEVQKVN